MNLASYIEHTLLRADATAEDIRQLCEEARMNQFAAVCVNGCRVRLAATLLAGSGVGIGAVVGFPLGAMSTEVKVMETRRAIHDGATDIDMVVNIGWIREGDWDRVGDEIQAVVEAAAGQPVKVILEVCLLSDAQIERACLTAVRAGAAYVKTSTGFSTGGATVQAVQLMRRTVGGQARIKAAGGIRSAADAIALLNAGADRLGTSRGIDIIAEAVRK